jgi:hypothetical protein
MRAYEGIAVAYFAALAVAALFPRSGRRRWSVSCAASALAALVGTVGLFGADWLRAWLPHVYLVAGYWLPALLVPVVAHPTRFERWLQRTDGTLRSDPGSLPATVRHAVELAYLFCYPLVPVSLAIIWGLGPSVAVHRFWLAVLLAGFACYGTLPWLVSRPPRLVVTGRPHTPESIAAVNARVLGRVSHRLNTFPSGHVAVSLASAAWVASVSGVAGGLVGVTAIAIAVGAVAGRYHYVLDVVLGVVVAASAVAIAAAVI